MEDRGPITAKLLIILSLVALFFNDFVEPLERKCKMPTFRTVATTVLGISAVRAPWGSFCLRELRSGPLWSLVPMPLVAASALVTLEVAAA